MVQEMKKYTIFLFVLFAIQTSAFSTGNKGKENTLAMAKNEEKATFGGGCFWCTEAIYEKVKGVISAVSGYSGGTMKNPGYKEVCSGLTGHAEVVQISFDPDIISYVELLEIFFNTHDPTTLNRQGADAGTQYRSVVFYHSEEQRRIAEDIIVELDNQGIWNNQIVTEINSITEFFPAEDYHQEYFENNSSQGYCRMVIQPKLDKFTKVFKDKLK